MMPPLASKTEDRLPAVKSSITRAEQDGGALERHRQAARLVDRGVDVAARDRVADPKQLIGPVGIGDDLLLPTAKVGIEVDLAAIGGSRSQVEVELAVRH